LVGFGAARPKQALIWGTVTTAFGAGIAFSFSQGLIKTFSTGLFTAGAPLGAAFFAAVLIGAVGWVLFATRVGLPVSTTHALMGALIGAGLLAFKRQDIRWNQLVIRFVVPLILSPLLSMLLVYVLAWPFLTLRRRWGDRCVCLLPEHSIPPLGAASSLAMSSAVAVVSHDL